MCALAAHFRVSIPVSELTKLLTAQLATVGVFPSVHMYMVFHIVQFSGLFLAVFADEHLVDALRAGVGLDALVVPKVVIRLGFGGLGGRIGSLNWKAAFEVVFSNLEGGLTSVIFDITF